MEKETDALNVEAAKILFSIVKQYPNYEVVLVIKKHIKGGSAAISCISNATKYSQIIERLEDVIEELRLQQKIQNQQ